MSDLDCGWCHLCEVDEELHRLRRDNVRWQDAVVRLRAVVERFAESAKHYPASEKLIACHRGADDDN
jgi:hypothetical protein